MSAAKRKRSSHLDNVNPVQEALERFRPLLSSEEWQALLAELDQPLYPALRLNTLKAGPEDLNVWAERYGWRLKPVPFCSSGWWVISARYPVSQTIEHRLGFYYIQEAASMLPVELFNFVPGERPLILDMAASPGGKTTHLVARTRDRGLVIANDPSRERVTALRLVLQTWGAINIAVTAFPGERWGQWYPEMFDAILQDAPCSMQSLRPSEGHPMRPIGAREQTMLVRRQAALLVSALSALKTGGQLVYATCTLTPEEDEGVLDEVLRAHPGVFEVMPIAERLPVPAPALQATPQRVFDPQVRHALRLWPHRLHTAGFFVARLRKIKPLQWHNETPPAARRGLHGEVITSTEVQRLAEAWLAAYGFDFRPVLEDQNLVLIGDKEGIEAVPRAFIAIFNQLPVVSLGLRMAEWTPEGWIPSHEWVARFGAHFQNGVLTLPGGLEAAWIRGEDVPLPAIKEIPSTRVVIVRDVQGRTLGRGRVTRERLKNMLPRRIVLPW